MNDEKSASIGDELKTIQTAQSIIEASPLASRFAKFTADEIDTDNDPSGPYIETETTANGDTIHTIKIDGQSYKSLSYPPDWMAGMVFLPTEKSDCFSYIIREIEDGERHVATVREYSDAVAIARYAVSHDGGYFDVIVRPSDEPVTHENFEDWFL
ncbi:hypothetical protein ACTZIH_25950 (plasmid) [Escherichia coli]